MHLRKRLVVLRTVVDNNRVFPADVRTVVALSVVAAEQF